MVKETPLRLMWDELSRVYEARLEVGFWYDFIPPRAYRFLNSCCGVAVEGGVILSVKGIESAIAIRAICELVMPFSFI